MTDTLNDTALEHGLTNQMELKAIEKIHKAMKDIADTDTHVDRGFGLEGADFWVTINGREWFVSAKISLLQQRKEMQ